MNKEQYLNKVDQPWHDFSEVCSHSCLSENKANLSFHLIRGASANDSNNKSFCYYERFMFRNQPLPKAFLAHDITMFGSGMFMFGKNAFIRQSRYLTGDVRKRIERSFSGNRRESLSDDRIWIVGGNASTNNYWHWMAQSLPAILQCIDMLKEAGSGDYGLLLPHRRHYVVETLQMLGLDQVPLVEVPADGILDIKRVAYCEMLCTAAFTPNKYRGKVRSSILAGKMDIGPKKVYLSRSDTALRPVRNEAELQAYLQEQGFTIVNAGKYSVAEQASIVNGADVVVGPHGANLTNLLFCREEANALELAQNSHLNTGPGSLMKVAGAALWLDIFPDDGLGPQTPGWEIDLDVLKRTLARIEESTQ